jgi:hypothetical protein
MENSDSGIGNETRTDGEETLGDGNEYSFEVRSGTVTESSGPADPRKRKRGRPRKTDGTAVPSDHTARILGGGNPFQTTPRSKSKNRISEDEIGRVIAIVSGILTAVRGPHWQVDETTATEMLGRPVAQLLETADTRVVKAVSNCLLPIAIAYGGLAVFGPGIQYEIQNAKLKRTTPKDGYTDINGQQNAATYGFSNGNGYGFENNFSDNPANPFNPR